MKLPLISVIVPVYKAELYLDQCLTSILNQTYKNLEIILVDDGSPDSCPVKCDEYAVKDARVKVVHKKNGGLCDARNIGVNVATGAYIAFIDDDDVVHETYIERLYGSLVQTSSDMVVCQFLEFKENKDICVETTTNERYILSGKDAVKDLYERRCGLKSNRSFGIFVTVWGKLYSRWQFENIEFPVGKMVDDEAAVPLLLYQAKNVCVISDILYYYRCTANSITHAPFSLKNYDYVDVAEQCANFFYKKGERKLYKLALLRKNILKGRYALYARRNGFYDKVPKKFKINSLGDILFFKKHCRLSWKELLAFFFPKFYKKYCSAKGSEGR